MDDKLENTLGRWAGENGLSIGEYLAIKGRLQRSKKKKKKNWVKSSSKEVQGC